MPDPFDYREAFGELMSAIGPYSTTALAVKAVGDSAASRNRYIRALAVIIGECASLDEAVAVAREALNEDTV